MKEQEGRLAEVVGAVEAEVEVFVLLLEVPWLGPGEGLL